MRFTILISLIMMVAVGCSKSPDQSAVPSPRSEVLPSQTGANNFNKDLVPQLYTPEPMINKPAPGEDQIGGASSDDFITANSLKPIIFGEGAGGITLKTTLEESYELLSKPLNPPDQFGRVIYDEGLYVRWRDDEPRNPVFIWVENTYQGQLLDQEGKPWIGMNHNFAEAYPTNRNGAENLARDIYKKYINVEENYDCVATGQCPVIWGPDSQKLFVIAMPVAGMNFVLSKDRFVLFRIAIEKNLPLGLLDNHLDIVNGAFLIPGQDPIQFGDEYQVVEARQEEVYKEIEELLEKEIEIETEVYTNSYRRAYAGSYLAYKRTDFDRKAKTAKPTDKLTTILVGNNYTKLLTIDGQPIIVREYVDHVELQIASVGSVNSPTPMQQENYRDIPLQVNMGLSRANVAEFSEKLRELLESYLKTKLPDSVVYSQTSGYFQKNTVKTYISDVVAFNKAKEKGLFIQFAASEENGHILGLVMTQLGKESNPFDSKIVPQSTEPVTKAGATYKQLAGFQLGDRVQLANIDIGRDEATLTMQSESGVLTSRVPFYERDIEEVAFTTAKLEHRQVSYAIVGSLGITLGLKELPSDNPQVRNFVVSSIGSGNYVNTIVGLCDGAFVPKFGMSANEFLNKLTAVECNYRVEFADNGNGNLSNVYFPNEQIRIDFSDQEMTATMIYAHESEVQ